jgi:membrane protein
MNPGKPSSAAGSSATPAKRAGFRLHWPEIKGLLVESGSKWSQHNAPRLGAALAFYSLLSLAPLLLVLVSIVGLVFGHSAAQRDTVQQVQALMGPAASNAVKAFVEGSRNTSHGVIATIAGLITLLFSASGVVCELRDALNTIWGSPTVTTAGLGKIKTYIKQRLFSFAVVGAIGFLLVVSLAISAWISALGLLSANVGPFQSLLLHVVNSMISFVVIAGLFAVVYKIMPDVRIEWRDVAMGGAVTSLLFTIGKLFLGLYLGRASFASTYGAAASIVVLIVWVYYSGQIFFLGAEFTRAFATRYGSHPLTPSAAQESVAKVRATTA